jgi:hypothetical protein
LLAFLALAPAVLAYPHVDLQGRILAFATTTTFLWLAAPDLQLQLRWIGLLFLCGLPFTLRGDASWVVGIPNIVVAALAAGRCNGSFESTYRALTLAASALCAVVFVENTGILTAELSSLCWSASSFLTSRQRFLQVFGPVQLGFPWLVGCLVSTIAVLSTARTGIATAAGLAALCIAGILLSVATGAGGAPFGSWANMYVICPMALAWSRTVDCPPRTGDRKLVAISAIALSVALQVCLASTLAWVGPRGRAGSVAILEGGLKILRTVQSRPLDDPKDPRFGGLPAMFRHYGDSVCTIPESFSHEDLERVGTLIVINPQRLAGREQQAAVRDFVREGGALVVLGDHTDIAGIQRPLHSFLGFTSIRFNYDSALPLDRQYRWTGCLRGALAPAYWEGENGEFGISVGASLSCGWRAQPLIVGDYAFSDKGDPKHGVSHLGNMLYDPGERLGGLILAASEPYGHGKAVVFADTAGWQDESLTATHSRICRMVEAAGRSTANPGIAKFLALTLLLSVFVLPLAANVRAPTAGFAVAASLAVAAGISLLCATLIAVAPHDASVFDASHWPKYPQGDPDAGTYRLDEAFFRLGDMLLAEDDLSRSLCMHPAHLVIMAPALAYSRHDAKEIAAYVRAGGRLLIFGGSQERDALAEILSAFQMDISPDCYGPAHNSRIVDPRLRRVVGAYLPPATSRTAAYDAEVTFAESYPVGGRGVHPLVSCWGRPLVVSKDIGRGRVVLVGDARFCTAKNLGRDVLNAPTVAFLLELLRL